MSDQLDQAAALELLFDAIPWREPILVQRTDGASGYACRFCIARDGLKGSEIHLLPSDLATVLDHIATAHPPLSDAWTISDA